ncbi:thiamine ABC transporter substrate-binding protein [Candidatus Oscillochloris fontis]|uniref:thiamine ABC transporter substrate-binding protein n=1 Tax=Candidatus Oscillochloris fontis TaxID=2496868 RepID=UPI00101C2F6F|nr:thiamine ABC transporter substrate-binding protein [Candidatus Oscillochloris fontis]
MKRLIALLTLTLLLTACGQSAATPTPVPSATAAAYPAASDAPTSIPAYPVATDAPTSVPAYPVATDAPASAGQTLVIMTHDSFSVSEEVLAAFTAQTGILVQVLKAGDAGTVLNQAILSKNAPLADLLFGVDNTFLSRALEADIFLSYDSPALAAIPAELRLDASNRLLPVDYGYVTINYDTATLESAGLTPPTSLEDLTKPEWRGKLVVEDPSTSSPGLAFLLATISHFGEEGDYTWKEYWRDLRANEVFVSSGWSDAYYTQFSGSSGAGAYPLVVSYATSPAAEVYFSEGALSAPPTGNLLVPGGSFRQIEFVGILKGTQHEDLARQFVDFMLSETFQADIPLQMFVYPALPSAPQPEVFTQFAEVPSQPAGLTPEQIEAGREIWLSEWMEIVLR